MSHNFCQMNVSFPVMTEEGEQHVIMQLEHDKKTMVPVKLQWLQDSTKVVEQMKKSIQLSPIYFFYHNNPTTTPSMGPSFYSKVFNPEIPACYKGYVGKKIYGKLHVNIKTFQNRKEIFYIICRFTYCSHERHEIETYFNAS